MPKSKLLKHQAFDFFMSRYFVLKFLGVEMNIFIVMMQASMNRLIANFLNEHYSSAEADAMNRKLDKQIASSLPWF